METNQWVGEQIADALAAGDWPVDLLSLIARTLPDTSVALARPAALVFQRLADSAAGDSQKRGEHLIRLSNWLSRLGRREEALAAIEEALAAIEEAVTAYRQLADAWPQVYSARLAASLQQQASLLEAAGRKPEADRARGVGFEPM